MHFRWSPWTVGAAIVGGVGAVVAAPVVLGAAGFTAAGITAGSVASSMMSASAIANGGGVVAGGVVATLQSAGAAGLGWAGSAAVRNCWSCRRSRCYQVRPKKKYVGFRFLLIKT
jgi:hypothetical protein